MGRAQGQSHATAVARGTVKRRLSPAGFSLSEAGQEGIPALARLMAEVAQRTYSPAHAGESLERWVTENCTEQHFRYRIRRSGYRVLVARDERGQILGTGTLRQRGNRADLSGIYALHPGTGTGRQILLALERAGAELGCNHARASVWRSNEPAKRFFAARGLVRKGGYREQTVGVMVDHYEGPLPLTWWEARA